MSAALHGGESCSVAVSRIIREDGLLGGRRRIAAQFAGCREAHNALRAGAGAPLAQTPAAQSPFALGANVEARGVCCLGPIPIPFRCG